MSQPLSMTSSTRHDNRRTILRNFLKRPIRTTYKLKDCTMLKNFMTSRTLLKGRRPEEDLGGKDATPIPEEVAVMTNFG
jgi:hypothetical protein